MNAVVSVAGLRKSFGAANVLRGVDFEVEPGSCTVLLGPSGSGKTTVLRSINALEVPDAGRIRVADVEVDFAAINPTRREGRGAAARLRANSAMVFQQHNLFPHMTVLQNVIEGPVQVQRVPREQAIARARELLAQVGLAEREDARPAMLSGGQQQRVGIARALALRPEVVLFDEPTSALDPELVAEVLAVIKDLAREGWTMMIVTHEIAFARQVADQVLFLDQGVVAERGAPAHVIDHPALERTRQFLRRVGPG
jgi:cystine transport system ATP-binding protein